MYSVNMINKRTKMCPLDIFLKTGVRLSGSFPVPGDTSTSVRPTDAIRQAEGNYLLLCEVTVHDGDQTYEKETILVRGDAISHIEFSATQWVAPSTTDIFATCVGV